MVTLDFRNCKTKEDVEKVFQKSGLKEATKLIRRSYIEMSKDKGKGDD